MDDKRYQELLSYLQNPTPQSDEYEKWANQFHKKFNHVYKGERRVVPQSEVKWIMSMFHDDPTKAHQLFDVMYNQISKRYIWQSMRNDIREYAKTCFQCQQRGSMKQNNQKKTILPTDIFERWGIDIVGSLPITREGNRYIVVAMDYFSRWPEARPLKAANAKTVATFIYEEIICRFGAPRILQSDRRTHFVNEVIQKLTKRFRVKYSLSLPYHPQSNGLVERFNKTLYEGIAKVAEELGSWNQYIQPILFAYRTKELRISKQSPYKLVYGKEPMLVIDYGPYDSSIIEKLLEIMEKIPQLREAARRAIRKAQAELDRKFEGKPQRSFQKGELVWYFDKAAAMRHDTKFQPK